MHTIDYDPFKQGGANITGLRMVDPERKDTMDIVSKWISWEMNAGRGPGNLTEKTLPVYKRL